MFIQFGGKQKILENYFFKRKKIVSPVPLPSSLSAFDDPQERCFLEKSKLSDSSENDPTVFIIPS